MSDAKTGLQGTSFTARSSQRTISAATQLLGLHHLGSMLVAIDLASRLGLTDEQIERGLATLQPVPHRREPRQRGPGVTFIDDSYNGNPDGVRVALEFLGSITSKQRTIYLTPGLVELGEESQKIHHQIGRDLATTVDIVGLIRTSVTPWIAEGLKEANFSGDLKWFDSTDHALRSLPSLTKPGDVILLQNDWPDQYA